MNPVSQPFGPCPCLTADCEVQGTILLKKTGHLRGCTCPSCRNAGNNAKGHGAQQTMHERLGGTGRAPTNEASARPYLIEVAVMPESKEGDQVPEAFTKFVGGGWFHHAMMQARRAVPVGSGVLPAVAIDGRYVIIDLGDPMEVRRASR